MSRFVAWIIGNTIAALFFGVFLFGQSVSIRPIEVSNVQTTTLVFDASICKDGVDRGRAELLARTVEGVRNVLLVKASGPEVDNTNLTVITEDGAIHTFRVFYSAQPQSFLVDLRSTSISSSADPAVLFEHGRLNQQGINLTASLLTKYPAFLKRPRVAVPGEMQLTYAGSYLKEGILFFQFQVENGSSIPFDTDFWRFYIRDRSRSKRSSKMEKEIIPLAVSTSHKGSIESTPLTVVVAFEKFTIAAKKVLTAELYEHNGDRHLKMNIRGGHILRSRPSPY